MYSANCGLVDSRTYGLADSYRKYLQLEYFFLRRRTACVSPRLREAYGLADSEYVRPNRADFFFLDEVRELSRQTAEN